MELFPELKCIYFEGNGLRRMTGLETNVQMRSLNLHENIIKKIEGIEAMDDLRTLNLADNCIETIEGIQGCKMLCTLYIKGNNIGRNGLSDLVGLLDCPSIEVIDVQNNEIEDPDCLKEIFMKMPNLKVLYLMKNPVTKNIKNYRKTVISSIPSLRYLDDRPVFEDDRRNADAWARGGIEEEREERKRIKEEKDKKHEDYHKNFKAMMDNARAAKKAADALEAEQKAAQKSFDEESVPSKIEGMIENLEKNPELIDTIQKATEEKAEDDAPPELEEVDIEEMRKEEAMNQKVLEEQKAI